MCYAGFIMLRMEFSGSHSWDDVWLIFPEVEMMRICGDGSQETSVSFWNCMSTMQEVKLHSVMLECFLHFLLLGFLKFLIDLKENGVFCRELLGLFSNWGS
jgi:hypothetical protein